MQAQTISLVDDSFVSQLKGLELQKGEMAAEATVLRASQPSDQPVLVGTYQLQWSRLVVKNLMRQEIQKI